MHCHVWVLYQSNTGPHWEREKKKCFSQTVLDSELHIYSPLLYLPPQQLLPVEKPVSLYGCVCTYTPDVFKCVMPYKTIKQEVVYSGTIRQYTWSSLEVCQVMLDQEILQISSWKRANLKCVRAQLKPQSCGAWAISAHVQKHRLTKNKDIHAC